MLLGLGLGLPLVLGRALNHPNSVAPRPAADDAVLRTNAVPRPSPADFLAEYANRTAPKADNPPDVVPTCAAPKIDPAKQRVRRAFHTLSRSERVKVSLLAKRGTKPSHCVLKASVFPCARCTRRCGSCTTCPRGRGDSATARAILIGVS
jgi:hypothetical protein